MAAGAQGIIRARRRGCPALDLAALLETLPPELRELCHRLEAETVFKISRATGVPCGTLYEPIKKLPKICEENGTEKIPEVIAPTFSGILR